MIRRGSDRTRISGGFPATLVITTLNRFQGLLGSTVGALGASTLVLGGAENRVVPTPALSADAPAPKPADRKALARQRARRREAVGVLVVAQSTVGYAITQLSDGLTPQEAREAAIEAASELEAVAAALRRLTRMGPGDRRRLALLMIAGGMTRREAGVRLGVSERTIRYYLAGGRSAGR